MRFDVVAKDVIRDFRQFVRFAFDYAFRHIFKTEDKCWFYQDKRQVEVLYAKVLKDLLKSKLNLEDLNDIDKAKLMSLFNLNRANKLYASALNMAQDVAQTKTRTKKQKVNLEEINKVFS